jgi:hypothetical protein
MTTATPLLSVYDSKTCIGFVIARGKRGYEAFDADAERSLGIFKTQAAAIDACMKGKVEDDQ